MTDPRIGLYKTLAERMALGDFHVRTPAPVKGDEIDQLGETLVRLGEVMDRQFEELHKLSDITEKVNAGLILEEVLDYVYREFRGIIPYDRIGFSFLEDDNRTLRARWARSEAPHMEITGGYSAPMRNSSLQTILETGQPRILNDLEAYLGNKPESDATARIVREGMRSSLTCPLVARGRPVGFMFFSSFKPSAYADAHVETFQRIAGQLSIIVEKSRLYQELLELNELKTRFLGMAAHDLRNPLCIVNGYLSLLIEDAAAGMRPDQLELLRTMQTACNNMVSIVETFLDISAIQSGQLKLKKESVALRPFMDEVAMTARLLSSAKQIDLRTEIEKGLESWTFDPNRIRQVLQNLLSNAVKYSDPGTEILLRLARAGDQLECSVVDHGRGIAASEISKLFKEFSQTSVKPTGGEKSIGLGLAICRRIVEAHGGSMRVESAPGCGSTFSAALP